MRLISLKYSDSKNNFEKIEFNPRLNLLIGKNGHGKSTVLNVIQLLADIILFKINTKNLDESLKIETEFTDEDNIYEIEFPQYVIEHELFKDWANSVHFHICASD